MLRSLLFVALPVLALATDPDPLAVTRAAYGAAVGALESALEGPAPLTEACRDACAALPSHSAARAELSLALTAADEGALRRTARAVARRLAFAPRLEDALRPAGFPAHTPVGEVGLVSYPAYRMAKAAVSLHRNLTFFRLFGHIQRNGIAMTAPVELELDTTGPRSRDSSMGFLYGSRAIGEVGPQGAVEVVDVDARTVASIGAIGFVDDRAAVEAARAALARWLVLHPELRVDGAVRVMGWNSPMVPRDQAYFEVQVPVVRVAPPAPRRIY